MTIHKLSEQIRDAIDGYEETKGRDSRLSEWADTVQALEDSLYAVAGQSTPNRWGYDAGQVALNDAWRARARQALAKAGIL